MESPPDEHRNTTQFLLERVRRLEALMGIDAAGRQVDVKPMTPTQRRALEFLAKAPWVAPWWGGAPHGKWPTDLPRATFTRLLRMKFIVVTHVGRFDRKVAITENGKKAIGWVDGKHT